LTIQRQTAGSTPPHSIEAEQELLGAMLLYPDVCDQIESLVAEGEFFEPVHGQIFRWLCDMRAKGQRTSAPLLRARLGELGKIDIAGMPLEKYVAGLAAGATTPINVPDFAKLVRDLSNRRRMIVVMREGVDLAMSAPVEAPAEEIARATIEHIDEIVAGQIPQTLRAVTAGEAAGEAMAQLPDALQGGAATAGITWGIADLDRRTNGIHRAELAILAGRPGMCKTGLGLHVGLSAAEAGHRALYWSGEMTASALMQRALTALAYKLSRDRRRIAYSELRNPPPNFTDADFMLLRDAQERLDALPLIIEQQPGLTIAQIAMRARRRVQKDGLDLLILDHLHKIRPADRYRADPTAETGEISNACAELAKELNIGVLALCQLSRRTEDRDDKRAQLSDLRQSGNLEQDADIVVFPYREAYYLLAHEPAPGTVEHMSWEDKLAACKDRLEINIAKQRQGATGSVNCFTAIECNVFYSAAPNGRANDRSGLAA
jgi:replicative DNA helicase